MVMDKAMTPVKHCPSLQLSCGLVVDLSPKVVADFEFSAMARGASTTPKIR